jgi:hypothetical protein
MLGLIVDFIGVSSNNTALFAGDVLIILFIGVSSNNATLFAGDVLIMLLFV